MERNHRLRYIDALRGLAILMVILHHSHPYFAGLTRYRLPLFLEVISKNGDKGVTLFFVLSAYTLSVSLANKTANEKNPLRNYFTRRFFRIAPMYYLAICLFLLCAIRSPTPVSVAANFLLIHGSSPYWTNSPVPGGWTVGIEVIFYLLLPLIFLKIKDAASALNLFIVLLLVAKLASSLLFKHPVIADHNLWGLFVYENIMSQLPVFLVGVCLFHFTGEPQMTLASWKSKPLSLALLAILALAQLLAGSVVKDFYIFAIAFGILAYTLSRIKIIVLVNDFTVWVGRHSYSLYLVHLLVANLLLKYQLTRYSSDPGTDYLLRAGLLFSLSCGISLFTYKYIEAPFMALGKRLILRSEHRNTYVHAIKSI